MRPFSADEIAHRTGGVNHAALAVIEGFATDTSNIHSGDLFLAIRGARVDGHDFAMQALSSGAVAALVERSIAGPHILVPNLVDALANFGRSLRDEFEGPVVGLTGSAGKTTTKEFLAGALTELGPIVKTLGNRNTEFTSPLLWAEVDSSTRAVVVELAMRGFDQIAHLAKIAQPTIGVVTNIGYSHLLQVGSRMGIAKAKGELLEALPHDAPCVLPADDDLLGELIEIAGGRPIFSFGFSASATCRIEEYQTESLQKARISGHCDGLPWNLTLPAAGRHLASNAATAILTAYRLGIDPQTAARGIERAELPPMRMESRVVNGATILLDAYNAAPPSVMAALETVLDTPVTGRRLAILGEMRELGDYSQEAHERVGAKAGQLDDVVFVGEAAKIMRDAAGKGEIGDLNTARELISAVGPGDVVLIKGSRALELEKALE